VTADEFMDLLKQGKIDEARSALEVEKKKAKFSPTSMTVKSDGSVTFRRKGKRVEQDAEDIWRLAK
jgi:hypothetical protein